MKFSPKVIWSVLPTLGRTRAPVIPPVPYAEMEWEDATPVTGKTKFSIFTTECVKCRGCEIICAFYREKENNPAFSRIRIVSKDVEWIEGKTDKNVEIKICRQCPGIPECMLACPVERAMYRHPETGAVVIDDELCIRCLKCVEACPYDAIWYNKSTDMILKCDVCGGKPKCVEWCPIRCLRIQKIVV